MFELETILDVAATSPLTWQILLVLWLSVSRYLERDEDGHCDILERGSGGSWFSLPCRQSSSPGDRYSASFYLRSIAIEA